MSDKFATVAWQGIAFKVPEDWSLVGVDGDRNKGYLRVDSPIASSLEVKWFSALGKTPDLVARGREFLSALEKNCRKKKRSFTSKIKADRDSKGGSSVAFSWQADRLGQGRLAYCEVCDRVVIGQVVSDRDENVSSVTPVVLGSLRDHREDGLVEFALYGLRFAVPANYRIEKPTLMSGYLSLSFKDRAKKLVVERWGLAETLLAGDDLKDWYRKDAAPDIKGYRFDIEDQEVRGHAGLKMVGRRAGVVMAAKAAGSSMTLHPHPGVLTGYAWHCAESNRLFGVRATHLPGDDTVERIRDLIKCH